MLLLECGQELVDLSVQHFEFKLIMDASTDVMATVLRCRTSDRTIQGLPAVRAALTVIVPDVDGQDSEPKVHA